MERVSKLRTTGDTGNTGNLMIPLLIRICCQFQKPLWSQCSPWFHSFETASMSGVFSCFLFTMAISHVPRLSLREIRSLGSRFLVGSGAGADPQIHFNIRDAVACFIFPPYHLAAGNHTD